MKRHGFALAKGEFRNGIALRCGWPLPGLPSSCACGASFDLCHALSCPKGGFPTLRHNEVRDVTASMLRRVANNVAVEPHLQPVTGERFRHRTAISTDQARLDIVTGKVWGGRFERCFFDVRIFNPYAASNRSAHIQSAFNKHEAEKRRHYAERVREVEMSGFTPLVLATTGGMGRTATAFYRRLAVHMEERGSVGYHTHISLIRSRLAFALLRANIVCLRRARSPFPWHRGMDDASPDVPVAEARLVGN